MSGFSQCPYCRIYIPAGFEMAHLACHEGYANAFFGKGGGSTSPSPSLVDAPVHLDVLDLLLRERQGPTSPFLFLRRAVPFGVLSSSRPTFASCKGCQRFLRW